MHDVTTVDPNTTTPTAPRMTDGGTLIPHLSLDSGNPTRAEAPLHGTPNSNERMLSTRIL